MSFENFIPQIWVARIQANLDKILVYGNLAYRGYEGEITQKGDTVRITDIGTVTVSDFDPRSALGEPQEVVGADMMLVINQSKAFHFLVHDIDQVSQDLATIDKISTKAARAVADAIDKYMATLYAQVAPANFIGSDTTPKNDLATAGKTIGYLLQLGQLLTEHDVPTTGRFVVIPPWVTTYLAQENAIIGTGSDKAEARLAAGLTVGGGFVGHIAGFDVYESNNVANTNGAKYKIIAGVQEAWALASKVNKVEAYRPEKRFADAIKGWNLFGAKVVDPSAMAVLVASKS